MPKKKEKVSSEITLKDWAIHILLAAFYGIAFMFLITNILLSQSQAQFYTKLVSGDEESLIDFFKHGRRLSSFTRLFPENKNLFAMYEKDIYEDTRNRRELIAKLEAILTVNPKSRDVLYSLYLLYEKEGDTEKAREYLMQAKDIDPEIGK